MVGRVWDWWRGRPALVDAAFMAPLLLLTVIQARTIGEVFGLRNASVPEYWALSAAMLLPLVWRRRWPLATFTIIALACLVQWTRWIALLPGDVALLIGLYTVTAYRSFRWSLAALAAGLVGAVLESWQQWVQYDRDLPMSEMREPLVFLVVVLVGVWVLGLHMRTRRAYLSSLEERAARLERDRENELRAARDTERARIARELHDVVAHNVSVIIVQADGASFAIDSDPARARKALETIAATGRTALAEMRRLLGVLREGDEGGGYAPQPGADQLAELVDQVRDAGLAVELRVAGEPARVSEGRQVTVFRIVQEALTNTLKHGGPRATARVALDYGDDMIEVRVSDDGRGAAAVGDGRGHGLVGMRERVAVYGGEVVAAPRGGGGFEVIARIPVREEART
ncbi:sensor histidine kinase [Actinomadura hibisca]|uniref:sensor histidine kinase n=1 Tax=Actinomadura hibisca TaxID=68565 RepID=UPI00083589DA|nr:sensor histidine kinase [Actinomadura hibisca]